MTAVLTSHILLDESGVAWIDDTNVKVLSDAKLLTRATELGRVLFSQDTDFLREAAARQDSGSPFSGVVFGEQLALTVGRCIRDLELIANVYDPPDIANRIEFLPLR